MIKLLSKYNRNNTPVIDQIISTTAIATKKKLNPTTFQDSTPLFIFNSNIFNARLMSLKSSVKQHWSHFRLAYSYKTNYDLLNTQAFKSSDCLTEVVSLFEYQKAIKIGIPGKDIVINGPNKTSKEISLAIKNHSKINIENFSDLRTYIEIAKQSRTKVHLGLRLRPTGFNIPSSRFGFSLGDSSAQSALALIAKSKSIQLSGFHIHLGTDIDKSSIYKLASKKVAEFISHASLSNKLEYIDFGGGFPASGLKPYRRKRWSPEPISHYIDAISQPLLPLFKQNLPLFIVEPGRFLVDDSISLISSVVSIEMNKAQQIIICNTTSTLLPLVHYRPQIVKALDRNLHIKSNDLLRTKVYGSSCREDDILFSGFLPKLEPNNYLMFFVVGAYNQSMGSEFIFPKPKMLEVS